MNITATSGYVPPFQGTQGVQSPAVSGSTDSDGVAGGAERGHKSRGGPGDMQQARAQALQSPRLTMAQTTSGTTSSNPGAGSTDGDGDGDSDASTSAPSSVKQDMQQFMHALFQAVKGESAAVSTAASSGSIDPKTGFAAGLSALISQVSGGSAPSDLQSAFSKLASDLQQVSPTAGTATTGSTPASGGPASTQATLQALLTRLQQDLGYGSSSTSAIGNSISTQV